MASLGNTLGAGVNWWLGKRIHQFKDKSWFPVSQPHLHKAEKNFNQYGIWCLLFSWVPIIGDAFTVIAGVLRVPFLIFIVLTAIGKSVRYAVLIGAVDYLLTSIQT